MTFEEYMIHRKIEQNTDVPFWVWDQMRSVWIDAKHDERKECAKIAWDIQMKELGGGTAIGNEISQRKST